MNIVKVLVMTLNVVIYW